MIRLSILSVACVLLAAVVLAQPAAVAPAITPVSISALDAQKKSINAGLGFVWDEQTLLCSFQQVKGASFVRVDGSDGPVEVSVVLSYSRYFDVVVLRTDGGLVSGNSPGSSDALGVGILYLFRNVRKNHGLFPDWRCARGAIPEKATS